MEDGGGLYCLHINWLPFYIDGQPGDKWEDLQQKMHNQKHAALNNNDKSTNKINNKYRHYSRRQRDPTTYTSGI
jgi:hypothetical protein